MEEQRVHHPFSEENAFTPHLASQLQIELLISVNVTSGGCGKETHQPSPRAPTDHHTLSPWHTTVGCCKAADPASNIKLQAAAGEKTRSFSQVIWYGFLHTASISVISSEWCLNDCCCYFRQLKKRLFFCLTAAFLEVCEMTFCMKLKSISNHWWHASFQAVSFTLSFSYCLKFWPKFYRMAVFVLCNLKKNSHNSG